MQLERIGLPQLAPQTPASQLSGGRPCAWRCWVHNCPRPTF
jgi:hypothetical protein